MSEFETVYRNVDYLIAYGLDTGLVEPEDVCYIRNRLLYELGIDSYENSGEVKEIPELEAVLKPLTDHMIEMWYTDDTVTMRDLHDTAIMGALTPRPSEVIRRFREEYQKNPKAATDYFYKLCGDCNYIRRYRIANDIHWVTNTQYGDMDITINMSKPEKDPRDIAAAKSRPVSGYPTCMLCPENEGYSGRVDFPARQNHRIIPVDICGEEWGLQYSPYVYYNEHCILLNKKHVPMVIDKSVFEKLFSFVSQFPHYFIGSNADLPIVGGSILTHEHFQGGSYDFAMAKAPYRKEFSVNGFEDVTCGIVKWPMSVIRLCHRDSVRLVELADRILNAWRGYSDPDAFIYSHTDGTPHNTITPVARMRDGEYELDLVLRNNITTDEHPLGVYHPHAELHHIKKENIGLIEVMGLAVLPSRLKREMTALKYAILAGEDIRANAELEKHADWVEEWLPGYSDVTADNLDEIIQYEIGKVFEKVLLHAGVFSDDEFGVAAFDHFVESI